MALFVNRLLFYNIKQIPKKIYMNKLILLRHGQSQWNLENRFTGWKNVPLTEKGEIEAKKAGELIKV